MGTLDIKELVDLSLNLLFYFTIGSFGAFFKVLYESMTRRNYKIRIGKIIIGGGTTAILCTGLNYSFLHQYNIGTRFMIAAIIGILGFEIFGKIRNIQGLKEFIRDILDILDLLSAGKRNDNSSEESTTRTDNNNISSDDETRSS